MTIINIYSLDDTEQQHVIASLPEGKHVIGRGDLLKVEDKRVSRNHALIEVSNDKITLASLHVNPCFFKAVNGRTLTVLTQNQVNELNDGDQFALLPQDYWFRVQIIREIEEGPHSSGKRIHDFQGSNSLSSSSTKKAKLTNTVENNSTENEATVCNNTSHINQDALMLDSDANNEEPSNSAHLDETARVEDIEHENISKEVTEDPTKDQHENNVNSKTEAVIKITEEESHVNGEEPSSTKIKTENPIHENEGANGSGVQAPARRERCWYGERCFRKNPHHRESFSHPGDHDYDASNQGDDPPECPYGVACYRRNPEHRKQYKHLTKPAPKPSNANIKLNILRGCPYCEHCKRNMGGGGGKPDYESDVDDY